MTSTGPGDKTLSPSSQMTTDPASAVEELASKQRRADLVVVFAPTTADVGRRVALTDDVVALGRDIDGGGLCLADRRMSRLHARFTFDARAGMYRVGDANSKNHTFVNGEAIETRLLSDGDVIRVGDSVLVYSEGDAFAQEQERADRLARTGMNLLLLGETGTGKEVLARRIHAQSGRRGPFLAINCASIPADLVGAELFGHTRNAFSGASHARKGMFLAADQGTLLLDEIGDCPLGVQAALLRAIQEKAVRPVGAEREVPVDVQLVAATLANVDAAVAAGTFRADLYARLSQGVVRIPPLRARKVELLTLLQTLASAGGRPVVLSADAAEAMLLWGFPLNVRELQSLVGSYQALHGDDTLDIALLARLAPEMAAPIASRKRGLNEAPSKSTLPPGAQSERTRLRALLEASGGNVAQVAETLGKPRAQIYRWMKSMGLSPEKFRR
jgi:transcriptional regulator with GAF, ATPase, and Fis domain